MNKLVSIAVGAVLFTVAAGASADPVALSGAQLDQVTAGGSGGRGVSFKYYKNIKVRVDKNFDVSGYIDPVADPYGHLADAEANATADGWGTFSETLTQTHTSSPTISCCEITPGSSTSNSVSISASSGLY